MSRTIEFGKTYPAIVKLFGKEGNFLKGKFLGSKDVVFGDIPKKVYKFELIDTNGSTERKENDKLTEVDVNAGEIVELFGSAVLDSILSEVLVGETVTITYTGLGTKRSGKKQARLYKAVVED